MKLILILTLVTLTFPVAGANTLTTETRTLDIKTGDTIQINSTFTNTGTGPTANQLVYLSLIDTRLGAPVDLEDWTANRSTNLAPIPVGGTAVQSWSMRALTSGDFAVYVIAIPNGTTQDTHLATLMTTPTIIHVTQRSSLNPGGVLPVILGIPIIIGGGLVALRVARTRADKPRQPLKETRP